MTVPAARAGSLRRARRAMLSAIALTLMLFLTALPSAGEICWDYTDLELAKVPLKCVEMGDGTTPCTWNPSCNTDLDPSDCCMAVYDPTGTQTIGEMHVMWHTCLGNVGTSFSPPPPNRGLRWYAFHRQLEADFNVYRESVGFGKIDSLEWCPGMNMPYGHFGAGLAPGAHPLNCGTGINRPNNVACDGCETFRECLYIDGAGPGSCGTPASAGCSIGGVSFPYTELQDFQNADEIATLLDVYFHGDMHGAVSDADGGGYNADCANPNCSTRDGMFWRLHKALDDVIRAWQNLQAVDVTLVIDRSGSMSASSGTGVGTRLEAAVEAADMFADLLEEGRSDGAVNRIGIISYSSNASNAALNMPLQDVDATLRDPGGTFETTLAALTASGSTSIGAGIEGAVDQLCSGSCATYVPAAGENERKAILLLTDGKENTAPCLEAGCQGGGGAEIDYTTLDVMQLCAVGLGNAASINGELLTILAERQGGIYLNNTDATGDDLKDFFTKCFAELTDEFIGLDPAGVLGASEPAGPIVPYESCDDARITFTSGWTGGSLPGDELRFLVSSPAGDAWVPLSGIGEMSTEETWAFKRCPLPYLGQAQGVWTMQLLRPQLAFVNGFTTDSFIDLDAGTRIVRRQIQRLCPINGTGEVTCTDVLYFEDGSNGTSVYQRGLDAESGLTVGNVATVTDSGTFAQRLSEESWDLIVYARQAGADKDEDYDGALASHICGGTPAIVTDTRTGDGADAILQCAGATRDAGTVNVESLSGDERFLDVEAELHDPGYAVYSYGLQPAAGSSAVAATAATFGTTGSAAIIGHALAGSDLNWHKNVLVKGLSQLTPFAPFSVPRTGDPLNAAVRILPSVLRAGGYPGGQMTVEVTRPLVGLGGLVERNALVEPVQGDPIDLLHVGLDSLQIPTTREIYALNDAGQSGDLHPGNSTFSAQLPINLAVDGMYTLHYRFEYPAGSCNTRRELKQTLFVEVKVSPEHSQVDVGTAIPAGVFKVFPVRIWPQDALGNVVGPGRPPQPTCEKPCVCDATSVVDENDGSYTIPLRVPSSAPLSACTIDAFDALFTFTGQQQFVTLDEPGTESTDPPDEVGR